MGWNLNYAWKYLNQKDIVERDELIAFGNFILKRREDGFFTREGFFNVTHADLENFKLH